MVLTQKEIDALVADYKKLDIPKVCDVTYKGRTYDGRQFVKHAITSINKADVTNKKDIYKVLFDTYTMLKKISDSGLV